MTYAQKMVSYEEAEDFASYAYEKTLSRDRCSTVRNLFIDFYRERFHTRDKDQLLRRKYSARSFNEAYHGADYQPDSQYRIYKYTTYLDRREREMLHLFIEGYTMCEIGIGYGIKEARVSQIFADIIKKIQKCVNMPARKVPLYDGHTRKLAKQGTVES